MRNKNRLFLTSGSQLGHDRERTLEISLMNTTVRRFEAFEARLGKRVFSCFLTEFGCGRLLPINAPNVSFAPFVESKARTLHAV